MSTSDTHLSVLNPHPRKISGPTLLHELVAKTTVSSEPAIEYLTSKDDIRSYTFAELHARSDDLARCLRAAWEHTSPSANSSSIVPLLFDQCPELYIAELAVLKAGGAFCPLPIDAPDERLRFICQDVEASVILTLNRLRDRLPAIEAGTIIAMDDEQPDFQRCPLPTSISPSQTAYVMYTSGSTGLPKGVLLSHSAATQAILAHDRHIPTFDRFLQFASPTFDVSVFEIFFPLFRGCTLVCGERRKLLTDLPDFINSMNIDAVELTPSVASNLIRSRENVPNLRLLLTIGEMLKRDVVEAFGGADDRDSILYGMYGPTEATIHCTLQVKCANDMSVRNIGYPLDTVSAFVVAPGPAGETNATPIEILPLGEEGELVVGGYQLADGYLNRAEQTNLAFINHHAHGRLYRTGDRARLTSNGGLECFGRLSGGQVKLRGQRIELGEIEYAASRTTGCQTVVADVIDGALIVFCVCSDLAITQSSILRECRRWLPSFMIPAEVLILEKLPYLDSGKTDRKALQTLWLKSKPSLNGTVAITTPLLKNIIDAASSVLKVQIFAETRLSSVGLDSLTAILLASELSKRGIPRPSATDLISSRTVREIEALVQSLERSASTANPAHKDNSRSVVDAVIGASGMSGADIEDVFLATPLQASMIAETMRNNHAYCNTIELEALDCSVAKVSEVLRELSKCHPLLRAGFVPIEGFATTHAAIVWKHMHPSQILNAQAMDSDFIIDNESDFLRPSSFRVAQTHTDVRITVRMHHSLYDQWSIDILKTDLSMMLRDVQISTGPSFRTVAAHYQNHLSCEQHVTDIEFWNDYLKDFRPSLLPGMSGKTVEGDLIRTQRKALNVSLADHGKQRQENGFTLATVFQTAMAHLLSSLIATDDVTFGVVHSGRHLSMDGVESIFGPCLTTLPLRLDLSTVRTCSELMGLVQSTNQIIQSHSLTPLSAIKNSAQELRENHLFDSLFIWQESIYTDELVVREINTTDHHEFNFVLELFPQGDLVDARISYRSDRMTEAQIDIFLRQLGALTQHIMENPASSVADLHRCLQPDVLSISNPIPASTSDGQHLLESFGRFADERPNAPAIVFAKSFDDSPDVTEMLTYWDLDSRSSALAEHFMAVGLLPGQLLCICMEKSVLLYVAIVAAIKAGAGYLPLVPETPHERIKSILDQSPVKICVCDNGTHAHFVEFARLTLVNVNMLKLPQRAHAGTATPMMNDDVAYMCFTSGSTGQPKGVAVTARNLLSNLKTLNELYDTRPGDRLLQACSQAFDVSVFEIFFAFHTGMCLCSARKDTLFQDLEFSIRSLGITHLSLTPTVAALVDPTNVPRVRFLVTAGEGITSLVHRRWAGRGLHQGYGPSETTNICTINMNISRDHALGNIGKPLRNTSAFVLSPNQQFDLLPMGALGEFAFGGEQVFQGYVSRPDLNDEKIVHHPQYGRIYKSGDLGRLLPDGSLLISGRVDDQVKIRGNRVELGEINSTILASVSIQDCATILLGHPPTEQMLVSYIVPTDLTDTVNNDLMLVDTSDNNLVAQLFDTLQASLPTYMMPSKIVPITHLPLTLQGKLDRRRLRSFFEGLAPETSQTFGFATQDTNIAEQQWTDQERQIASALARTIGIDESDVARNTSFLALGLNSLTAISFAKTLKNELKVDLKVSTVLQNRTVSRLAVAITMNTNPLATNGHLPLPPLLPQELENSLRSSWDPNFGTIEAILPCSPLQEAMLSAGSSATSTSYYNTTVLRLRANTAALAKCWETAIKRHQILRTRFLPTDDIAHPFVQVVVQQLLCPVIEYYTDKSAVTPQDLENPSKVDHLNPLRIIFSPAGDGTVLTLQMHHAIYDGISMSLLLSDIENVYHGRETPNHRSMESFLIEVQKQNGEEALAFWSSHLKKFQPKPFPVSRLQPNHSYSVSRNSPTSSFAISAFSRKHSTSELAIFQAALAKTLAHCQSALDICFGNVVSGRTVPVEDIGSLIAPCFNTIPIRVNLENVRSNLDLVLKMNAHNVDTLSCQLTALRKIQAFSDAPQYHLFDSLLLLQPQQDRLDHEVWTMEKDAGSMDLPAVFEVIPQPRTHRLVLHTQTKSLSRDLADSLMDVFADSIDDLIRFANGEIRQSSDKDVSPTAGFLGCVHDKHVVSTDTSDDAIDPVEGTIREVFASLAAVDARLIGRQTSMYQIGLDSLNAAQVAARLRKLGVDVDATDVMVAMTPQSLASLASSKVTTPSAASVLGMDFDKFEQRNLDAVLERVEGSYSVLEKIRPCTSMQSGLIAQSIQSEGRLYINHITFELPPGTMRDILNIAWNATMRRHQVLRTGFHEVHDSEAFHAMAITTAESASVPMLEANGQDDFDRMERRATKHIMDSLRTQAWVISLQSTAARQIMMLSIHHGLYDADGLRMIFSDLSKAMTGMPLKPAVSIDRVLRDILTAAHETKEVGKEFWKDAVQHANISKFPSLTPTAVKTSRLDVINRTLNLRLPDLKHFCREHQATIQATGQTAWAMLLAAYTGDTTVIFGTIMSDSLGSAGQSAAFPSITTIPVPCQMDENPKAILRSMMDFNAEAQRHRHMPLSDIQRYAGRPGEQLFDTVFVYQKTATSSIGIDWPIVRENAPVEYSLSLELEVGSEETLDVRLTFDERRVAKDHAELLLQQFEHTLTKLVGQSRKAPENLFSQLEPKQSRLPSESRTLHGLVEHTIQNHPDRIALEFVRSAADETQSISKWSYRDLGHRAFQVASLLRKSGVKAADIVAVCMHKCPEASFAFLGILKAGCAFLAIDPELPESRKDFILQDSGARILLTGPDGHSSLDSCGVICIEIDESSLKDIPMTTDVMRSVGEQETCYCLYTSGTTGTPKGCELSHENAVQAMMAFQRLFAGRWTQKSRWLQFASYWFDVSMLEQFWSWSVGITVIGAPRDIVLEDIAGFISRFKITHIDLTPSLARLVQPQDVPSLWGGVFITGGEALKQEIIDAWGPKKTICNGYGPTEATIGVTMNRFVDVDAKPANIGRQFDNVGTYVLRPDSDEAVLKGAVGELCVSGRLVGKGYLRRPNLTAAAFPYLQRLGKRIYRTGDLVRMLTDGSFLFIGRKDSQTKLRGQRLEVAEIDSILLQAASNIAYAVSLVLKNGNTGRETLISFFTTNPKRSTEDLVVEANEDYHSLSKCMRKACVEKLPGYMVPTHIIPINFMPLTVNNKTDDKSLAKLYDSCTVKQLQGLQKEDNNSRDLNETEHKVYSELCRLLHVDESSVSPESNIFSLGLSSISAIPLATNLKRCGFPKANVAVIMKNPTLCRLSSALSEASEDSRLGAGALQQTRLSLAAFARRHRGIASKTLGISVREIETVLPCTPLQQGVILESQRNEIRPYFNHFYYEIKERDITGLLRSFQKLVDNAQILRARFLETDDGYAQVILREDRLRTSDVLSGKKGPQSALKDLKTSWLSRNETVIISPFEVHVVRTSVQTVLAILIHHALYDGISLEIMLDHVASIHSGFDEVDFGPKFTNAIAHGPLLQIDSKDFWTRNFYSIHSKLPTRELAPTAEKSSAFVSVQLENKTTLDTIRKELGVSHSAVVQGLFEIALRKHVSAASTYGVVVSGRSIDLEGADRVIGPMFNTLPLNLQLQTQSSVAEHITRCHARNMELLPFQHTPLTEIKKWCGHSPQDIMFDVLFVFQHHKGKTGTSHTRILKAVQHEPHADYPLACEVELHSDGTVIISLLAQCLYFDNGQLNDFIATFEQTLNNVSSDESIATLHDVTSTEAVTNGHGSKTGAAQANGISHFEWNEDTSAIRKAISSVAGVPLEDIDEHTTLFSAGLDSIDAVKLLSRLRKAGLTLPVSKLLQAQTIPKISEALGSNTSEAMHEDAISLLRTAEKALKTKRLPMMQSISELERLLPTTPQQEGLIADMLRTDFRQYFNHDVLRLRGNANAEHIKAAWQTVVDGSPILRTIFVEIVDPEVSATYAQAVLRKYKLDFKHYRRNDIMTIEDVFDEIRTGVQQHIETLPPFRITFVDIGDDRYVVLSISHAQYDGHSLALLHEDLKRAYWDQYNVRPAYDEAIESTLTANNYEARNFWVGMLSGANPHPLHGSMPKNSSTRVHRAEKEATIDGNATREFCRSNGISMQALAQTCWAVTLAHYTRSVEVLFGVVLACRDTAEAQEVMFPTMNTVVVRTSLHGSLVQMLQYMQSSITDTIPFQKTPLRTIQAAASMKHGVALFDTLFIYQKRPAPRKLLAAPLYDSVDGSSDVQYPVAVEIEDTAQKLFIRAACKDDSFDLEGTNTLLDTMDQVLNTIIKSPNDQTVAFEDGLASFCGLSGVLLEATESSPDEEIYQVDEEPRASHHDGPAVQSVLEALAQVSKVPIEQLNSTSTVESIGIDSISAIKVAALLRKKAIYISVSELIRARTAARIAGMAKTGDQGLSNGMGKGQADQAIARIVQQCDFSAALTRANIDKIDVESIIPATAGQIYLLNVWRKTGGQVFYPTFTYQIATEASLEEMKAAWDEVVAQHAILRTVFCTTDAAYSPILQLILQSSSRSAADRPMVNPRFYRTDSGWKLELRIHHALYDAVSLDQIIRDLQCQLTNEPLTNPTLRFQDYIALTTTESSCKERKLFWTEYLRGVTSCRLPQPNNDGPQKRVEIFQPALSSTIYALGTLARTRSISIQALLFAAYAIVYAKLATSSQAVHTDRAASLDVVLGVYLSNRSHLPEMDTLPAPPVNMVPLLVRSPRRKPLIDVAQNVQRDLGKIASIANSSVSLWEIAEWTDVKVDTFVNFLKLPEQDENRSGERVVAAVNQQRFEEWRKVTEPEDEGGFEVPHELEGLEVKEGAYQHSVDVEMRVMKDGRLDVGLFCPEAMLSLAGAERALEEFKKVLDKVVRQVQE